MIRMSNRINTIIFCLGLFLISALSMAQDEFQFDDVQRLSDAINSEYDESSPIYDAANKRLYFTRTLHPLNKGGASAGQDIWYSDITGTSWSLPQNNIPKLNNMLNNSVIGVSGNLGVLYLLGSYQKRLSLQQGFSYSIKKDGLFSDPNQLSIPGLKFSSDFYGGWLNEEGNVLVISMDSKNSEGQEDLYISIKTEGKWSRPVWMGAEVNSSGYEISPMLIKDNTILIFASNGHGGLGDCDIFYSERKDSTFTSWSEPVNMGAPINSSKFDGYPFMTGNQMYFSSNRGDTFSNIYVSSNLLYSEEADTMRLAFKMYDTQLNDVEVIVKNKSGDTIGNYLSDEAGVVNVSGLQKGSEYLLFPSHEDVEMSLFDPYILNQKGEIVQKLSTNADGTIKAKALSAEETKSKSQLQIPAYTAGMHGILELENVPVRNVLLALVDDNGKTIQYSKTDQEGKFAFIETADSLDLNIKILTQLEYLKSEGIIYITGEDGKKLFKAKPSEAGVFEYEKLSAKEISQLKMLQQQDKSKPIESKGVYKYENLPKEGVELSLYDSEGNLIETVVTDENGEFVFTKLKPDQGFSIRTSEEDEDGSFLALYDKDGIEMDIFSSSEENAGFDYKPLSSEFVSGLSLLDEEEDGILVINESKKMIFSTGVFKYKNLPREGITLRLLDEEDNVVETVTTNADGQFVFSMLRENQNYKIEVENLTGEEIDLSQIYFIGKDGGVISTQNQDDNSFAFEKLARDYFFSVSELNDGETALMLTENFNDVSGKFKYQNLPKEGVKLYLVDENGNVIETVYTDENGEFKFNKLARDKNYAIRLSEEDEGMMSDALFEMSDAVNGELAQATDASGIFSFTTLPKDRSQLATTDVSDSDGIDASLFSSEEPVIEKDSIEVLDEPIEIVLKPEETIVDDLFNDDLKLHAVYFAFNSIRVSERDRFYINQKVMPIVKKTSEPVLIVGYSCNIGDKIEQENISQLRAEQIKAYLLGMGVDESRIEITGIGTTLTEENSTYETRAANRKADLFLLGR